jgi:hypothetical protein
VRVMVARAVKNASCFVELGIPSRLPYRG